jgi:hypothetical protein
MSQSGLKAIDRAKVNFIVDADIAKSADSLGACPGT